MDYNLKHLVGFQVSLRDDAGCDCGVRHARRSECMDIDRQGIGAVIACSQSMSLMPALHLIWTVSCFGFRSALRVTSLYCTPTHHSTLAHLCERLYDQTDSFEFCIYYVGEIDWIIEMHPESFQHWKLLADRVGTSRLSNTESYLRIELEVSETNVMASV